MSLHVARPLSRRFNYFDRAMLLLLASHAATVWTGRCAEYRITHVVVVAAGALRFIAARG